MKKNVIIMSVVVGLVFVAAIVVFVLAYVQDHENERQLLQVCWLPSGEAQYIGDGYSDPMPTGARACSTPEPIVWPQGTHLTFAVVEPGGNALDGTGDESSVIDAMHWVNDNLGVHLTFVQDVNADVVLIFRAAYENDVGHLGDEGGYCVHVREDGRLRAHAAVRARGSNRCEYLMAIHEIGHCLGLGHDGWGIMVPSDVCSEGENMQIPRFGDAQRELMVETYPE